jgi:hypothetical protein
MNAIGLGVTTRASPRARSPISIASLSKILAGVLRRATCRHRVLTIPAADDSAGRLDQANAIDYSDGEA